MQHYLLNKTETNLVFRSGYVFAQPGVWTPVSAYDVASGIFRHAVLANQIEIEQFDTPPTSPERPALYVPDVLDTGFTDQGLTADQLQQALALKGTTRRSGGETTPIGEGVADQAAYEGSLTPPEDNAGTSISGTEVPEKDAAPEDAPSTPRKRGRKAAISESAEGDVSAETTDTDPPAA